MEHHDLVLAFIRFQIDQFDRFHEKAKKYAPDAETTSENHTSRAGGSRHRRVITISAGTNHTIILGAKQKPSTIRELLDSEDQGTDQAFTSFRSRVSLAIKALSPESVDATAINDSHQVRSPI